MNNEKQFFTEVINFYKIVANATILFYNQYIITILKGELLFKIIF
ncbi:hypothetical protein N568_0101530 [Lactococcus garvieae TRF1]|uniref:Uncharacterized protein n=1 Tax=Lactococcus garvieae TRF1 TaxID=1380772 RepID=V8ASQ9_9LACT|nr:hypothetical protein N568_0101530 [Lactococcus garvieae TRF1]